MYRYTFAQPCLFLLILTSTACDQLEGREYQGGSAKPVQTAQAPFSRSASNTTLFALPGEAIIHHLVGEASGDWFGYSVCALGDVDGDGVPDFAVGAHQNENWGKRPAPDAASGYVNIYSGSSGERLSRVLSKGSKNIDGSDDHLGFAMTSVADQDGDGARDLLAGAYLYDADDGLERTVDENTGAAFVFSSRGSGIVTTMGGTLWGDRFGYALSSFEDLDGDGREDFLISAEKTDGAFTNEGSVMVISSATYTPLVTSTGPGTEAHLGCSVSRLGDVNGDEVPDYAAGAFMHSAEGEEGREAGWTGLYSGVDGSLLRGWTGEKGAHLGYTICCLGDLNGDGVNELAVGANQSGWVSDFSGPGYVRIYSCADGELLYQISGKGLGDQFGWGLATASDHDRDGLPDLLVGAPASISVNRESMSDRPGAVYLVSARDGSWLGAYHGLQANDQFGASVADIGDIDGDGIGDILVGAPENVIGQTRPGYALVISGAYFARGRAN